MLKIGTAGANTHVTVYEDIPGNNFNRVCHSVCNALIMEFVLQCMGFLSNFKKDIQTAKSEKAARINGRQLKELLEKFKVERDRIEKETGVRPLIDESTRMFMQKILNVWMAEGKNIDEERFWNEVDHYRQFSHPVEYYEIDQKD